MEAILKIKGEEIPVEITGEELDRALEMLEKPVKKTGYERKSEGKYYRVISTGRLSERFETDCDENNAEYKNANYYSDKTVAENNARADRLLRQLRRFAAEHREKGLDWRRSQEYKYYIYYKYYERSLAIDSLIAARVFGCIYFDSRETAEAAIEEFKDELIWYFTEYKDSL